MMQTDVDGSVDSYVMNRRSLLQTGFSALALAALPCAHCPAQGNYGLQGEHDTQPMEISPSNPAIALNKNRCEQCGDCRWYCQGFVTVNGWDKNRTEHICIYCGQCTLICPGQALTERFDYPFVRIGLQDQKRTKIAVVAPSLRVSIGEMFGLMPGTNVEGKLVAGLKKVGFDKVLDNSFAADVTIMEEATELIHRLENPEFKGPHFTSCCPAWVRFAELFYPEFLPNISSVKSPFMIEGSLIKTWYADKNNLDPQKILAVAVAPCTGKKYEILQKELLASARFRGEEKNHLDIDFALTTREVAQLFRASGVTRLVSLPNESFDPLLSEASGAGHLFGSTGGVLAATLRTAWWILNGQDPPESLLNWETMRGMSAVKTATVDMGKRTLRVAAVNGTANIRSFLEAMKREKTPFDCVEMMACPGGCIGGGGQPRSTSPDSIYKKRAAALHQRDEQSEIRLSYKNPEVKALYDEFLLSPMSEKAMALLHRHSS